MQTSQSDIKMVCFEILTIDVTQKAFSSYNNHFKLAFTLVIDPNEDANFIKGIRL